LIVSKCSDHVPLYRGEDILVRHGLHIPRSTLCDWVHGGSMLLLPLVAFMTMRVLQQPVLWTDDTPVMFFDRNGRLVATRRRRSSLRRGRFWPYIARGDAPYSVFEFTVSRHRDGPATVLSGWSGFLHADACSGYDSVIHDSQRQHLRRHRSVSVRFVTPAGAGMAVCHRRKRSAAMIGGRVCEHDLGPRDPGQVEPTTDESIRQGGIARVRVLPQRDGTMTVRTTDGKHGPPERSS